VKRVFGSERSLASLLWTSTQMSTRMSTSLVTGLIKRYSDCSEPQGLEQSRSAVPRRSTSRAPYLDGSEPTRGHNGECRTVRAGLEASCICPDSTNVA
jgi:hypothetical protein